MRRAARIEAAARIVVDANPKTLQAALALIAALRSELETTLPQGHTPQLNRDDVIGRYKAGERQAAIARTYNVTRYAVYQVIRAAREQGQL